MSSVPFQLLFMIFTKEIFLKKHEWLRNISSQKSYVTNFLSCGNINEGEDNIAKSCG